MNYEGFVIEKAANDGVLLKVFKTSKEFTTYVAKDFQEAVTLLQGIINGTEPAAPAQPEPPTEPVENAN